MLNVPDIYSYCYSLVKQIPEGMVSTYSAVAEALGDRIAARAVGKMLCENPYSFLRDDVPKNEKVPCHRVVLADGTLGGFTSPRGISDKIKLLENEGIIVKNGKIQDFEKHLFMNFVSEKPLQHLRKHQEQLASKISLEDSFLLKDIGIVDVAYRERKAFCAMVVVDEHCNVNTFSASLSTNFPYIPTYLAFREIPCILKVLEYYRPSMLLVDGNGILHPRKMGIATHLGIIAEIPTIGIAKSLLLGEIKSNEIYHEGKLTGYICGKYYISPGHRVSVESAKKIACKFLAAIPLAHRAAQHLRNSNDAL